MTRIADRQLWDRMAVSFWFTPLVMAAIAILLTWVLYWADGQIPNSALESSRFILSSSVEEIRSFLFAMATTCLATAGVVFSLLTLPLSTVASQYGSRLLRIFQGDHITQFVLGMFVGTFVYCISGALVLPSTELQLEPPQLLGTVAFLLFMATFASLILLIHHITALLQAPTIAAAAGRELLDVVRSDIRTEFGGGAGPQARLEDPGIPTEADGYPVRVAETGYIKSVDPESLLAVTRERNLLVRLLHKPGHFVGAGSVVALVWPSDRVDPAVELQIQQAFRIGRHRTPTQDVEYAVNQLTEMAVRAMSPAINDPFTAMTCLDYMGYGLGEFVRTRTDSPRIYDRDGRLRIVFDSVTFDQLLEAAFGMLRHAARNNAAVLLHMLDVIEGISLEARSQETERSLAEHVILIEDEGMGGELIERDREAIRRRSGELKVKLTGSPL